VTALLAALGAALGAPTRYLVDLWIQARHGSPFPWGTWTVNVTGSLLLGVLAVGASTGDLGATTMAGLGTGFCGALTTYSTFGYETLRLLENGAWRHATANVVLSLAAGLAAAAAGVALGSLLWT
jgi:CrcB protein